MQKLRKMVKSIDKSRDREYYRLHIISERDKCAMEMSDNANSENTNQIEPAKGFNPELTTEEKLQAAAEFDDLVQSILLRFKEDVVYDRYIMSFPNMVTESRLLLSIQHTDDFMLVIEVWKALLNDGFKIIDISFMCGDKENRHEYYINDDSFVVKCDNYDDYNKPKLVGVKEISKLAKLLESAEPRKLY